MSLLLTSQRKVRVQIETLYKKSRALYYKKSRIPYKGVQSTIKRSPEHPTEKLEIHKCQTMLVLRKEHPHSPATYSPMAVTHVATTWHSQGFEEPGALGFGVKGGGGVLGCDVAGALGCDVAGALGCDVAASLDGDVAAALDCDGAASLDCDVAAALDCDVAASLDCDVAAAMDCDVAATLDCDVAASLDCDVAAALDCDVVAAWD